MYLGGISVSLDFPLVFKLLSFEEDLLWYCAFIFLLI